VPHRATLIGYRLGHDPVEQGLFLQGAIGNETTLRRLARQGSALSRNGHNNSEEQKLVKADTSVETAPRSVSWNFTKIPLFLPERASRAQPLFPRPATPILGAIQAKLVVGQANDPLEHEADRIADQVMRMPDPNISLASGMPQLSRACAACEQEEGEMVRPKAAGAANAGASSIVREVLRSPGQPLDAESRAFFEPRFGRDLSDIRIHADARAAESAREAGARAYAYGRHIVFGDGHYAPGTEGGRALLAHEVAHTIQQEASPAKLGVQRDPDDKQVAKKPADPREFINRMTTHELYIDNNIHKISFFGAEQAIIYYSNGSSLELGLVPRWMKAPFAEVDYHTPREALAWSTSPGRTGFIRLAQVPPNATFAEMQTRYFHEVDFVAIPIKDGARIVPNRVNMLTAPKLCSVLLHSEEKFEETTAFVAEFGIQVALAIAEAATAAKLAPRGPSPIKAEMAKVTAFASARPVVRKLAAEMQELLVAGGSKDIAVEGVEFTGVEVSTQAGRLAVKRYLMVAENPGLGQGSVVRAAFEEAAVNIARINGLKTVTIDVGFIVNPGWRVILENLHYVRTTVGGLTTWIKTINL
jgi:hypothetical protein